ncbi:MAG: DUF2721 domain-containing protein [Bacteroidota bacterium]
MVIDITVPALLFPAISLLLLAYTNRFLAIATLIRDLYQKNKNNPGQETLVEQINNLRTRVNLIRNMQIYGVSSFFLCVLSMFMLFWDKAVWGSYIFGASIVLLMVSLALSIQEIRKSTVALNLQLSDLQSSNAVGIEKRYERIKSLFRKKK